MTDDMTWRTVWPGEWTCDNSGYIWSDSLKGGRTHMIDVRGWGYLTGHGSVALALDEDTASRLQDELGRLIASAPDLLEALKTVRDYVSDMAEGHIQQTPALTAMAHEDLARIDAAIARATGEAA